MKIEIVKSCLVNGKHYEQGTVADIETNTANSLVTLGRAVFVKKEMPLIQQAINVLTNRDDEKPVSRRHKNRH